jgi:hypothetical protein
MADQTQAGKPAGGGGAGAKDTRAGKADEVGNGADHAAAGPSDPTELLRADHRKVQQLFAAFEKASSADQKAELADQICTELVVHALLEEEIFYPACKGHMEERMLNEAQVEHDGAKTLIIEVKSHSPQDQYFDAKVKVLSEEIKHHINEEEKPNEGILAKAKQAGIATSELAERMTRRKAELMEEAKAGRLGPPRTRSFRFAVNAGARRAQHQENEMSRGSTMTRERDEQGRFVSDDDDYGRRSSRRDDDDRRYSRSRDDDDDYRRGGRGHGGWFGDPEGHSEASRRGWEEREGGSRSSYRDDDRRSSRSRDDDDDRRYGSRDRGQGGWFGDPEGHSEASRRGWEEREGGSRSHYRDDDGRRSMRSRDDDDDYRRGGRGHGGWFGDPEGHSEAARRGWDEREGSSRSHYRSDDDRRSSRSRDDDDDRRRDHGQGGWFGDPEGHAEAARRGWDEREGSRSSRDDDDRRYSRSRDDDDRRGSRGGWYGDSRGHSEAARRRRD